MSDFSKKNENKKYSVKSNNPSRKNFYLETERDDFNKNISKKYINTFDNQNNSKIETIKNKGTSTEIKKKRKNKSSMLKNKSFSKFNFNDVLNFNFGSKNPAELKLINTSVLTGKSPEKNSKKDLKSVKNSEKKIPLYNKSINMQLKNSKYLLGNSLSRQSRNDKNNRIRKFISEDKFLKKKNGILILPPSKYICKNEKKIPKINYNSLVQDKELNLIKKYIKEQNYDKIKKIIEKDDEKMNQQISEKLNNMNEKIKKYKLKRPNEETEEGVEKLFEIYNKRRGKRYNFTTNLTLQKSDKNDPLINIQTKEKTEFYYKNRLNNILMDTKGNQRFLLKTEEQKSIPEKITDFEISTLANRANRKVENKFPDLCAFNLPKILHQNKEYNLKLLYDVFIEFKSLLKCGMVHNRNLDLVRRGIDFDTFFNCNTKINQQGIDLSKKIFKAFNNKTNLNFMSWQHYFDGMMKIKDQNIDNKLDLFFQILDENGDGSFDYNEVYNLSLISLQRVLAENKKKEESENKENKSENEDENVTNILAEFLTKFVFELVDINIDGEIPIDLLRAKMDEKNEQSDYLEFFLCADNFA